MRTFPAISTAAAAVLLLSACTGERLAPPPSAGGSSGYVVDAYPRRSWHPSEPPDCCGGVSIRLEPAPPCPPPPMTGPCPPAPCPPPAPPPCPPPCPPPIEVAPCSPAYVPPPCPPPCEPAPPSCWTFTPRVRYWRPAPSGDVLVTIGSEPGTGTTIDLEDDLDLDDADSIQYGLAVAYGRHRVRISYEPVSWEGSAVLDRSVIFHGITYNAGETIDSEIQMDFLRWGYDYALVNDASTKVRVGLEAYWWQFEGELTGSVGGTTSREYTTIYPALYVEAEAVFGSIHARAEACYGTLFQDDRTIVDLEAAIGLRLFGRLNVDVGWRYWNLVYQKETNLGDMVASGPFAELSIDI